jgi:hypothetical protein
MQLTGLQAQQQQAVHQQQQPLAVQVRQPALVLLVLLQAGQQGPLHLRPLICLAGVVAVVLLLVVLALQQVVLLVERRDPWTSCVVTRSSSC